MQKEKGPQCVISPKTPKYLGCVVDRDIVRISHKICFATINLTTTVSETIFLHSVVYTLFSRVSVLKAVLVIFVLRFSVNALCTMLSFFLLFVKFGIAFVGILRGNC